MTKNDIIALPNKSLRQRSQKVGIVDAKIIKLIEDMQDATIDWENSREHEVGVALAAVQIDVKLRIIVIRNNFDDKDDHTFKVFINPVITKYEGKLVEDYEGCLSVPNIYGKVLRHDKVRIKAQDENGKLVRLTATGFLARIFQHEIDHTNGIVFIDHIKNDRQAFYRLRDDGHLEEVDYEKDISHNRILW